MKYSHFSVDHLRTANDVLFVLFAYDDYITGLDSSIIARECADIAMDVLQNPYKSRPLEEWFIGSIVQQYVLQKKVFSPTIDNPSPEFGPKPSRVPVSLLNVVSLKCFRDFWKA
jgi:hypothetical protein